MARNPQWSKQIQITRSNVEAYMLVPSNMSPDPYQKIADGSKKKVQTNHNLVYF
jgi:hypothetical protein